jgi:hypothetical protein
LYDAEVIDKVKSVLYVDATATITASDVLWPLVLKFAVPVARILLHSRAIVGPVSPCICSEVYSMQ